MNNYSSSSIGCFNVASCGSHYSLFTSFCVWFVFKCLIIALFVPFGAIILLLQVVGQHILFAASKNRSYQS